MTPAASFDRCNVSVAPVIVEPAGIDEMSNLTSARRMLFVAWPVSPTNISWPAPLLSWPVGSW